jgi:phospholipid-transporting ATPase
MAARELTEAEWLSWKERTMGAQMRDAAEEISQLQHQLECNLTLLGGTAILDQLQDDVAPTLEVFGDAGIAVWVLTGDKPQTARSISLKCGLIKRNTTIFDLTFASQSADVLSSLRSTLDRLPASSAETAAVLVDGKALALILGKTEAELALLMICQRCRSVICARMSPMQKALVVGMVRRHVRDSVALAIGDGANDVSMIRKAHLGVGISGREGMQAAQSADFAISQFRFLRKLVLVHGQFCVRRTRKLIQYSLNKNLVFTLPQFYFLFLTLSSGQAMYDDDLQALFNVFFTFLPIVVLAIFDIHTFAGLAMHIPALYRHAHPKAHVCKYPVSVDDDKFIFSIGCFSALWQSAVIFCMTMLTIDHSLDTVSHAVMGNCAYTLVVLCVNIKVMMICLSWTFLFVLALIGTAAMWFVCNFAVPEYPDMGMIMTATYSLVQFWLLAPLIVVLGLAPEFFAVAWQAEHEYHHGGVLAQLRRVRGLLIDDTDEELVAKLAAQGIIDSVPSAVSQSVDVSRARTPDAAGADTVLFTPVQSFSQAQLEAALHAELGGCDAHSESSLKSVSDSDHISRENSHRSDTRDRNYTRIHPADPDSDSGMSTSRSKDP